MQQLKRVLPVGLLALLAVGCVTPRITNLTPSAHPRNPTGLYLVEMQLDSRQQTLRHESITPHVVIGFKEYKMRPILRMDHRWETYIPVPANEDAVLYHFKVDYQYNRFGKPGDGSRLSPEYKLSIE